MVSPPPGVSSTSRVPSMPSTNPFESARPKPSPVVVVGVAEPLERREHVVASLGGDSGSAVDDPQLGPAAERARGDPHPLAVGGVAHRVREQVHDDALQEPRVGEHRPQVVGKVELHLSGAELELVERREHDVGHVGRCERDGERARLQPAHVEQVGDERGEGVEALGGGVEQFRPLLGRERDLGRAQRADGGRRRRERAAEVVADGGEERRAHLVRLGELVGSFGGARERAVLDRGIQLGGDDLRAGGARMLRGRAVQLEHAASCRSGMLVTRSSRAGSPSAHARSRRRRGGAPR